MAINEIRIKRGDQLPKLTAQLQHVNGDPVDLTGATVQLQYRRIDADDFVGRAMTVTNALTGMIEYQWVAADTVEEGRYEADFEATYADGSKLTVPTSSHVPMHVYEDLGPPGNGGGGNGGGTTVDLTLPVEFKPATQVLPGEFSPDKVGFFLQNTDGTELMRIVATDPDVANDWNSANLYIGFEAGKNAATDNISAGFMNMGIGWQSMMNLTTGSRNTMVGHSTGYAISDGTSNVAVGFGALGNVIHGVTNVAIGDSAGATLGLGGSTGCSYNTFIGYQAGKDIQSGDHNIYIGAQLPGTAPSHHELNIGGIIKGHIDTGRVELKAAGTAPADASLDNSQYEFWIDEAGNKLTAKVKYADGVTVKTGVIALDGSGGGVASGSIISDVEPRLLFNETDAAANAKLWDIDVNGGIFAIRTRTDADGTGAIGMRLYRSGAGSISNVHLIGNFVQVYSGDASAQRLVINSSETRVGSGIGYSFASTSDASSATDTDIRRSSAGVLKFGNGSAYDSVCSLGDAANRINAVYSRTHFLNDSEPRLLFTETDQGTDAKLWDVDVNGGVFSIRPRNDADSSGLGGLSLVRTALSSLKMRFQNEAGAGNGFLISSPATTRWQITRDDGAGGTVAAEWISNNNAWGVFQLALMGGGTGAITVSDVVLYRTASKVFALGSALNGATDNDVSFGAPAKRIKEILCGLDSYSTAQVDKTDVTFADLTGCQVNVEANGVYAIGGHITCTCPAAGGAKVQIVAVTATATDIRYNVVYNVTGATSTISKQTALGAGAGVTAAVDDINITGYITVGTAGSLKLQVAQGTASGTSNFFKGAWFRLTRIA